MKGVSFRLVVMLAVSGFLLFVLGDVAAQVRGGSGAILSAGQGAALAGAALVLLVALAIRALYSNTLLNKALMGGLAAVLIVNVAMMRHHGETLSAPLPAATLGDPTNGAAACLRASEARPAMADLCKRIVHPRSSGRDGRQAMLYGR